MLLDAFPRVTVPLTTTHQEPSLSFSYAKDMAAFTASIDNQAENEAPNAPWKSLPDGIPNTKETLLPMLLDMYWDGVFREVKHIIISLFELRDDGINVEPEAASDDYIYGFDAYIDQICESAKEWAVHQSRSLLFFWR